MKNIPLKIIGLCVSLILVLILGFFLYFDKTGNNKPVDIVFITDNNYVLQTRTAIKSIVKNKNYATKIEINILGFNLSDKNIKKLEKEKRRNVKINVIKKSDNDIKNLDIIPALTKHVTRADYLKFFLPTIFKDKDKILYLDADTIILKDLKELYNTDINDYYIAAADEWGEELNKKRTSAQNRYFNNGVLLFNLKKMRENDIENKLMSYKLEHQHGDYATQDTFNNVIDKTLFLNLKYNTFGTTYEADINNVYNLLGKTLENNYNYLEYMFDNIEEYRKSVVIIHFAGFEKPWYAVDFSSAADKKWYRYAPFEFWIGKIKSKIKKFTGVK